MSAQCERIDVPEGFEQGLAALRADDDAAAPRAHASWLVRDKCKAGLGAYLPEDEGMNLKLGALVAFRTSAEDDWQLGSVIRRVRAADETRWLAGIKRISDSPVALPLKLSDASAQGTEPLAIYAPASSAGGRIDSLVLDANEFARGRQYRLPTRGGAFRIKLNRVIDRGDGWVRVGFEVIGKQ
jgi:hypothetical protein